MILHLVDDEKVINRTVEAFEEALPGENHFLCFAEKGASAGKLVRPHPTVEFYDGESGYTADLTKYDRIVFHFLNYSKVRFCKKYIRHAADYYWIVWSGDLYNSILRERGYKLFSPDNSYLACTGLKSRCSYFIRSVCHIQHSENKEIIRFVRERVRYIVTECERNFHLICSHFHLDSRVSNLSFFYYPIREILGKELAGKWVDGSSVLLGNSASFTNNHEYVLNLLRVRKIEGLRLIVPLSYGGNRKYKALLTERIHKDFPGSVILHRFLPLEEYNRLLVSASICIFGNWRSEAYGNILVSLYLGAKVYLSSHNPLLEMLQKMGIKVFELEKLKATDFYSLLTEEERRENRRILSERYSKKRMLALIREELFDPEA